MSNIELKAQPVPKTDQGKLSNIQNTVLLSTGLKIWARKLSLSPKRQGDPTYCRCALHKEQTQNLSFISSARYINIAAVRIQVKGTRKHAICQPSRKQLLLLIKDWSSGPCIFLCSCCEKQHLQETLKSFNCLLRKAGDLY